MLKKTTFLFISFYFAICGMTVAHAAQTVNYVALGDSIAAYFRLEKEQGYAELLAVKLVKEGGYDSVHLENLAQSGDDSQDLLNKIESNKNIIAKAEIITVCIGGNNFLGTLVEGMLSSVGITEQMMESQGVDILRMEISDDMYRLATNALKAPEIQAALAKGIAQFRADFPKIIANIREIAPNADIYIMTVYNPLEPDHPIYPFLDPVEVQINTMIKATKDVTVVDVYTAYENFPNRTQLSIGGIDPHPSADGQRLIANEHYKAITGKESSDVIEIIPIDAEIISANEPSTEVTPIQKPSATPADSSYMESPPELKPTAKPIESLPMKNSNNIIVWLIAIPILALAAGVLFYIYKKRSG